MSKPERFLSQSILTEPLQFNKYMGGLRPVTRETSPDGKLEIFVVTGYQCAKEVFAQPEIYSSEFGAIIMGAEREPSAHLDPEDVHVHPILLTRDDPDHKRYRDLFNPIFSPKQVNALSARMEQVMDELIDSVIERGECDFLNEIAVPFPITVISDLLGFDRSYLPSIRRWSDSLIAHIGQLDDLALHAVHEDIRAFNRFLVNQLAERRRSPGDDVLSQALQARIDGIDPLTDHEILIIAREITVAGNESTRNTLVAAMALLAEDPALMDQLRDNKRLIPIAVEEFLRLFAAVAGMWRVTTRDTILGGVSIPRNSAIMIRMDAANRDPQQFPDPDRIDLNRSNRNTLLTFGYGPHYCLGNMLARRELAVAIEKILTRLTNVRVQKDKSDFTSDPHIIIRGLKRLSISFDPGVRTRS